MKVNFQDCEFGVFEPHVDIEYDGKKYRAAEIKFEGDDKRTHTVIFADCDLLDAMRKKTGREDFEGEEERIDNMIGFYPESSEGIYYCLEQFFGEKISQ